MSNSGSDAGSRYALRCHWQECTTNVRAGVVADAMNVATPGLDWRGARKGAMEAAYVSGEAHKVAVQRDKFHERLVEGIRRERELVARRLKEAEVYNVARLESLRGDATED